MMKRAAPVVVEVISDEDEEEDNDELLREVFGHRTAGLRPAAPPPAPPPRPPSPDPIFETAIPHGMRPLRAGEAGHVALGIDPGSTNLGLCVYDAGTQRVLAADLVHYPQGGALSAAALIERMRTFVTPEGVIGRLMAQHCVDRVYIEDQRHTTNDRQSAIQHALHTLIGPSRCEIVEASAIKRRYKRFFPPLTPEQRASVTNPEAAQRRANKRSAVEGARHFFPMVLWHRLEGRQRLEGAKRFRLHDICDGYFIARYGAERRIERDFKGTYPALKITKERGRRRQRR